MLERGWRDVAVIDDEDAALVDSLAAEPKDVVRVVLIKNDLPPITVGRVISRKQAAIRPARGFAPDRSRLGLHDTLNCRVRKARAFADRESGGLRKPFNRYIREHHLRPGVAGLTIDARNDRTWASVERRVLELPLPRWQIALVIVADKDRGARSRHHISPLVDLYAELCRCARRISAAGLHAVN